MGVVWGQNRPAVGVGSDVSIGRKWAWSGGLNGPTIDTGSDVSNWGGAVGVVWGQNGPAIGVGSDVSIGRSGHGLEA